MHSQSKIVPAQAVAAMHCCFVPLAVLPQGTAVIHMAQDKFEHDCVDGRHC